MHKTKVIATAIVEHATTNAHGDIVTLNMLYSTV